MADDLEAWYHILHLLMWQTTFLSTRPLWAPDSENAQSLDLDFLCSMFALRIINYKTTLIHAEAISENFKLEIYLTTVPDK